MNCTLRTPTTTHNYNIQHTYHAVDLRGKDVILSYDAVCEAYSTTVVIRTVGINITKG